MTYRKALASTDCSSVDLHARERGVNAAIVNGEIGESHESNGRQLASGTICQLVIRG
jgi:hypothetical protein